MKSVRWKDWKYYLENDVQELYKESLPLHIKNHVKAIVEVEPILEIITI